MRTVIGAVHDNRIVGNAEFIELVEHRAHVLVMVDHDVVVDTLPASGLSHTLRFSVGTKVHMGEIHPNKERLTGFVLFLDELR